MDDEQYKKKRRGHEQFLKGYRRHYMQKTSSGKHLPFSSNNARRYDMSEIRMKIYEITLG